MELDYRRAEEITVVSCKKKLCPDLTISEGLDIIISDKYGVMCYANEWSLIR